MSKKTSGQQAQPKPTATPRQAAQQPPQPLEPEAPVARGARPIKVRALRTVYYDHQRRREGDVFQIEGMHHFSKTGAMELVDARTPEKTTTSQEKINQAHDEILAGRTPSSDAPIGE